MAMLKNFCTLCLFLLLSLAASAQLIDVPGIRESVSLNEGWSTAMSASKTTYDGFERPLYTEKSWTAVDVPHNWEDYQGYRRMKHGSLHGYAWYRKSFEVENQQKGKRYFLFFEGVGSYATVWVNGKEVGRHAGGRTSFTLDVTGALNFGGKNLLAVRADHPAEIRDLPWVCGGCSPEWGFSEGSQPMGIFRPVSLIITSDVRVEPFGVHVWNNASANEKEATLYVNTEVKNYRATALRATVTVKLLNPDNKRVESVSKTVLLPAGQTVLVKQQIPQLRHPLLWSPEQPNLYKVATEISEGKKVLDRQTIAYGIRTISWPVARNDGDGRFYINGKPFFINGVCEYEHNMGRSHAFTEAMVDARVAQMRAAGFNSFRDAHQPHSFRYGYHWDRLGIPWWTQFSAHIWFDTPEFRESFKSLLRDWVKERRNSPSVVMWGLQNESTLPEDFAKECVEIIRELDPTTSSQRVVTTCNGGVGTDWNVVQNWSGTYGGNPYIYDKDMERQLLNGEYGAWRSIDLHTEGGFDQKGPLSEDRMTQLMEMKVRLAEEAKDKICGQYQWLFNTHENPGRTQNGEGLRELDRLGPLNYKGLFTAWGEPVDAYYMYRANYAPKAKEPMVYIPMHTWPDRWTTTGVKDSVVVYSNCDAVELWNDTLLLAMQRRDGGIGTHFTFRNVNIQSNLLHAYGKVDGSAGRVAGDIVLLHHLPRATFADSLILKPQNITQPTPGYSYLYRVNCGGPDYTDINGHTWMADVRRTSDDTWGSRSWTDDYPGLPPFYGSQRRSNELIDGTYDQELFRTFRYGQHKLRYEFPVPNGDYVVELYFAEPWYGSNAAMSCAGWRQFDVAVNGKVALKDFDIWKTVGAGSYACKKVVKTKVVKGVIEVSFPRVASGQAVISGIAIAAKRRDIPPAQASPQLMARLSVNGKKQEPYWAIGSWMDTGDKQYSNDEACFSKLPPSLYGASYLRTPRVSKDSDVLATFTLTSDADVHVGIADSVGKKPHWMEKYTFSQSFAENGAGQKFALYSRRFAMGETVVLGANLSDTAPMYMVAATYATTLESASDLRPTQRIEAEEAKALGSGIRKDSIRINKMLRYTHAVGDTVEFTFSVGVADTYTISIRYMNRMDQEIPMLIQIEDTNGILMRNDYLTFKPTPQDKFKSLGTTTGTQINAGTYKLRLINAGVEGLVLDYVEVQ